MKKIQLLLLLIFFIHVKIFSQEFSIPKNAIPDPFWWSRMNFWTWHTNKENTYTYFTFKIIAKDSTIKNVRATMLSDSIGSNSYFLAWGRGLYKTKDSAKVEKIYPSDTKYIVRTDNMYKPNSITTDTGWLFKVAYGRINAYSFLPEENVDDRDIRYIQKDGGPLIEINYDELEEIIKDDPRAYKFFKEKKYLKAIRVYNLD